MLQNIHDKAKGWIAYAIVGLITIPFALFGINSYFEGGGKLSAAVVNGEEIPVQAVQNALLEMKQQFGGKLPAGLDDAALKTAALDSVINQTLMQQKIRDGGYRASNQEVADAIAAIDVFQKDGKFDKQTYENLLKTQRRDPADFEARVRTDLSQQQLRGAVLDTAFLPKAEAERYQSLRNQQREVELFTLKAADSQAQAQVTDEQVSQYYTQNKASFMTEEKAKLAYLEMKRDDLAAKIAVDEPTLKKWFEENAEHFVQPEERTASHILVSVADPAKDADAKKRIDALYADMQAGKRTFEDIAKTDSDDKVAAEKNGLIGTIVTSDWGPEFVKAVSALKAGETSAPVKTEAGYEIIRITELKPAVQKTFEQARATVEQDYRKEQADKEFADKADQIQKLAYENDGALEPVSKAVGLTIQQSDWITRSQGQGVAADEKVRTAAFAEDVLKSGKNSDMLELADGHAVVVRVINHEDSTQKPLDAVKAEIRTSLLAQEARKLTAQKGEDLLKKLTAAQAWSVLTASGLGAETAVEKPGLVGRTGSALAPEVADQLFSMTQPAAGKASWSSVVLANGDYVVMALKSVKAGETALDAASGAVYDQSTGSRELDAMLQGLRETADIVTHPENL
ncbi:MAG: SurA N-terminal domain-containing protein [Thiothrix sp.]|uniref:SurA N-terminal domain-containing protein n=1 Tax=Thiothrix sp. TaxID=1032 RepID=UPI00260251EE|nr:SurA N-terminal domain-containing protein [Thiothrix sp.]MDD5394087.1 SurA N-terminal domain-containing protein [Thiothrix sp.]